MNQEAVIAWIKRKKSFKTTSGCLLAVAALLAGLLVLFLTFWFAYLVIWCCVPGVSAVSELVVSKKFRLSHEWRLGFSGVFIVMLFIEFFRTNPWRWFWFDYKDVDADRAWALGRLFPAFALLSEPAASANLIVDIFLIGPRLVIGSWKIWRESRRFNVLDEKVCAEMLSYLMSIPEAVPHHQLRMAGWEEWYPDLRHIDGVIFLEKGITLSQELRRELIKISQEAVNET